jgi:hypothetical protein
MLTSPADQPSRDWASSSDCDMLSYEMIDTIQVLGAKFKSRVLMSSYEMPCR